MLISENNLDQWVRGNARDAQARIVDLVCRLVAASSPRPRDRRFPRGDSIGQHGADGYLDTEFPHEPFVLKGRSYWEIGTGLDPGDKATKDYRDLTAAVPEEVRRESVFTFVTPLSGRRTFPDTWKPDAQRDWVARRRARNEWREVRVIDGTRLVDWIEQFPAVLRWMAQVMGIAADGLESPETRWDRVKSIGAPPDLPSSLFTAGREEACARIGDLVEGSTKQLQLDTYYPDQVASFVSAHFASLEEAERIEVYGRALVVSSPEAWKSATSLSEPHVLIADFVLGGADDDTTMLLEAATRAGHASVYGGAPGGIPHANRVPLPNPTSHQVKESLESAGYPEERARVLAQQSAGNLGSLLRCLQNVALHPAWAERGSAAEIVIAELLGTWDEGSEADKKAAQDLSGKDYGEWIRVVRDVAVQPDTPLVQSGQTWRFQARYEGWYSLGPRLFDDHLDRLREVAERVLIEDDPQFDLPADQRFAAAIHNKTRAHSRVLRTGIAETLALLGSHHAALTSCTSGKAEAVAARVVRNLLDSTEWRRWAGLNDVMPLLAEASPSVFLRMVEQGLEEDPCPFDGVFNEESSGGLGGTNYITGLLWALETLAWESEHLGRVVLILGELAHRDPGGQWANRPSNSLSTIFCPWLPQTCAPIETRRAAVHALLRERPDEGWDLVRNLLDGAQRTSSNTRRPAWRQFIPDEWRSGVTNHEYFDQVSGYSEAAVDAALVDAGRVAQLVTSLHQLAPDARERLIEHLESDATNSLHDAERLAIWTTLSQFVNRRRKYSDVESRDEELLKRLSAIVDRYAPKDPALRSRRLFSGSSLDLFEERGNYAEQEARLNERRLEAVREIVQQGGIGALVQFAETVAAPWQVGWSLGGEGCSEYDSEILPALLGKENSSTTHFAAGYTRGRFAGEGWDWVDSLVTDGWTATQVACLFASLPFGLETWERVADRLGDDDAEYWTTTTANPYESDSPVDVAIERLLAHDRPGPAIECLARALHRGDDLQPSLVVSALLAVPAATDSARIEPYRATELIKALQQSKDVDQTDLMKVEWAYLSILDGHHDATPLTLERKLATEPAFFGEVVALVFRRRGAEPEPVSESDQLVAQNAYRLLSNWRVLPGSKEDGSIDGDALEKWVEEARSITEASGRLEVSQTLIGQVLFHAPPDSDGLWIDRSVAKVLDARNARGLREGYSLAVSNSRGAFWHSGGKQERELEQKYRSQAADVEAAGFVRLAGELRGVADSYAREAERAEGRDPFDD